MMSSLTVDSFGIMKFWQDWFAYCADCTARTAILTGERQKQSNKALEMTNLSNGAYLKNHPLSGDFNVEVIADGQNFQRPIGYVLLRFSTKAGYQFDPAIVEATADQEKSIVPLVISPPRAGKNGSVTGLNPISQVSLALKIRKYVYMIDYLPWPDATQTLDSVCEGIATLLGKVCSLHPETKPNVVADCQAGWLFRIMEARHADKFNCDIPTLVVGAPLSFLSGKRSEKQNRAALRFLGSNGKKLAELLADLDGGFINGRWLTMNFDLLDMAYTLSKHRTNWEKAFDKKALAKTAKFSTWWDSGVYFTKREFVQIMELFMEDKFRNGTLEIDGQLVKAAASKSPRLVLCSEGDTIVPPEQSITDIFGDYHDLDEFKNAGQRLCVYIHEKTGHMGIFVSGGVLINTHLPIYNVMGEVADLAPGIYKIIISDGKATFHECDFDFLHELKEDADRDRELFAKMVQKNNPLDAVYSRLLSPSVEFISSFVPDSLRPWIHPTTMKHALYSNRNPAMQLFSAWSSFVAPLLPQTPISEDNLFKSVEASFLDKLAEIFERLEFEKNSSSERNYREMVNAA